MDEDIFALEATKSKKVESDVVRPRESQRRWGDDRIKMPLDRIALQYVIEVKDKVDLIPFVRVADSDGMYAVVLIAHDIEVRPGWAN